MFKKIIKFSIDEIHDSLPEAAISVITLENKIATNTVICISSTCIGILIPVYFWISFQLLLFVRYKK